MIPTSFTSRIALTILAIWTAGAAAAQMVPYADIAGFKIARVEEPRICLAALEKPSEAGRKMIYTYYQTAAGQRWHVAGYDDPAHLTASEVALTVTVDTAFTLERRTEAREGDFMFPFASLEELLAFEASIPDGETLIISTGEDQLNIDLGDMRAALGAITACLGAL